jgi:hypothetical protein
MRVSVLLRRWIESDAVACKYAESVGCPRSQYHDWLSDGKESVLHPSVRKRLALMRFS